MSAIDGVRYATGQTDKFRGTGVWSFIKFEREQSESGDESVEIVDPKTATRNKSINASTSRKQDAE